MKIKFKNILPVKISDIETIRVWRNQEQINAFMDFQASISREEQLNWFQNLKINGYHYFMIHQEGVFIGTIYVNELTLETGIMLGDYSYSNTGITFKASFELLVYAFDQLNLTEVFAKVKGTNKNAVQYNEFLGFKKRSNLNSSFIKLVLTKSDFYTKKEMLEKLIMTE